MQVNAGPTSPTAVLLASVAAAQGATSQADVTAVVIGVTLLAGVIQIILGALGMGLLLTSLLSWPVRSAFLTGAAVITVCSQVTARGQLERWPRCVVFWMAGHCASML